MSINLLPLDSVSKLLFAIELEPVQGSRFQPTGFPSLGAATYETSTGTSLLVESAQSMANRLESVCWDTVNNSPVAAIEGISYVRVECAGKFFTSSLTEAHRLNSVYIERASNGSLHTAFRQESHYDEKKPVDRAAFAKALLKFDVNSLIHGVFLESIGGRLRVARALSAFIEADEVKQAVSGGVKIDHIQPGKGENKTATDGFGNLPFSREEYTAKTITLFVNFDLAQIRGYGLGDSATRLLILLALFKIRALLDGDLRLRTACDLTLASAKPIAASRPEGFLLPSLTDITLALKGAITATRSEMAITTVTFEDDRKKSKDTENEESTDDGESEDTE